jgi:hypothetical protein
LIVVGRVAETGALVAAAAVEVAGRGAPELAADGTAEDVDVRAGEVAAAVEVADAGWEPAEREEAALAAGAAVGVTVDEIFMGEGVGSGLRGWEL